MKARVILTGEIIDVIPEFNPNAKHATDNLYVDKDGLVYYENQLEFLNTENPDIDWEQRRYEIAKSAMQGLLANEESTSCSGVINRKDDYIEDVAYSAVCYADALIKELKGGSYGI